MILCEDTRVAFLMMLICTTPIGGSVRTDHSAEITHQIGGVKKISFVHAERSREAHGVTKAPVARSIVSIEEGLGVVGREADQPLELVERERC
jgi:hypothetical protein